MTIFDKRKRIQMTMLLLACCMIPILVGMLAMVKGVSDKDGVAQGGAVYIVTAYCPCEKCCGEFADGITASGVNLNGFLGLCIAAPPEIPFGTIIEIPSYGIAAVADRGGKIKGQRLDVYFPTHQEALDWGVQELKVRILP